MSRIDILAPVFVRSRASLELLLEKNDGVSLLSRLLAVMKQYARVTIATNERRIEDAGRAEGFETIFLEEVNESPSGLLPDGWQEAGDAYFGNGKKGHLLMVDLFHPFSYQSRIVEAANAWAASGHPLAVSLEAAKDHPCQIDFHFSARVEAMAYQPVRMAGKGCDTHPSPSDVNLVSDVNSIHSCNADECWVIPVIGGGARGDLMRAKVLGARIRKEEDMGFQFPPETEACLLLWIRKVQTGDDPIVAPLRAASGPWKVGADGMRYLTDNNQPLTGRQMFPEVLQLNAAIIMARREGWENLTGHVKNNTFYPLLVRRDHLSDSGLDTALGLLGLLERP